MQKLRGAVCPRLSSTNPKEERARRRWFRVFWEELRLHHDFFVWIDDKSDVGEGIPCGVPTFFTPKFPWLQVAALERARWILTFRDNLREKGAELGIPTIVVSSEFEALPPTEAARRLAAQIRCAPPPRLHHRVRPDDERLSFCAIADQNYFPFFLGLWENLRDKHDGNLKATLLALDETVKERVLELGLPVQVVTLSELFWGQDLSLMTTRCVADQAYASKARLLERVLAQEQEAVFYFDLDVYFFRSPAALVSQFHDANVLLFPQWADSLYLLRRYGMFNAGMMGVAPGAEPFLKWWGEMCLREYHSDPSRGYFVDQGFLDLAPLYFPRAKIYRGHDENIACWNLTTHGLTFGGELKERLMLFDGRAPGSFHAVNPDRLGSFELKHGWDQAVALGYPRNCWANSLALKQNTLLQQRVYWLELSRYVIACEWASKLTGVSFTKIFGKSADFFLTGFGKAFLKALSWIHYPSRPIQDLIREFRLRRTRPEKTPHQFWIGQQRKLLFDDN